MNGKTALLCILNCHNEGDAMREITEFNSSAILCKFCRKRKATKLCDAIVTRGSYAGHPPKGETKIEFTSTCDNAICDKCSTKVTEYMDLCPTHRDEMKEYAKR